MTGPPGSTPSEAPGTAAAAGKQPGCFGNLFLDITGLGFLLQLKRQLGTLGFSLAFSAVMLFMFVLGARIERYAHLGEHQYVMQLLPMASCFSPLLAFLMTIAFGIGDCLTNATYWLFPTNRFLNLYTLFKQPHPLLTWGAYARMDFVTLPLFAILPGLGSRVLYSIVSRSFQSARARVMKDGGDGDRKALQAQLDRASQARDVAAGRADAADGAFQAADARASQSAERIRSVEANQEESARALERANAATSEANAAARSAEATAEAVRKEASREGAKAEALGRTREAESRVVEQKDADLRLASNNKTDLEAQSAELEAQKGKLDTDIGGATAERDALAERAERMRLAAETGHAADGREMGPDEVQAARAEYLEAQAGLDAHNAKLDELVYEKRVTEARWNAKQKEIEVEDARCEKLLQDYREASKRAEAAAREEEILRKRHKELDEDAARQAEKARSERARAEESEREAQAEAQRQTAARAATERAVREANAAAAERNARAQALDGARREQAAAEQRVQQLGQALGVAPPSPSGAPRPGPTGQPPGAASQAVAPGQQPRSASQQVPSSQPTRGPSPSVSPPGLVAAGVVASSAAGIPASGHRRPRPDPSRDFIRQWDQAMYAEMERARREREAMIRAMQERYSGSLPSGLPDGAPAAFGSGAAQSIAGIGAAVAGAAIGGAVGGGLLSGHMWAEYFPLREWLHPSRTADPSCYKMDVGYLNTNILSGTSSAAGVGPVSVVAAEGATGGAPPTIPGVGPGVPGGVVPPGLPPEGMSPQEQAARDAAKKARDEADAIRKQWQDSEATADKSDPNYQKLKQQYDDYIKSKESEADAADAQADGYKQQADAEAAAKDQKAQWIRTQQEDVKRYAEEKAHLEGVIAGAAAAGFDTSDHKRRLAEIDGRLKDVHGGLQKEGADVSYQAASRGVIAPGKEFVEARSQNEALKQQAKDIEALNKLQKGALNHDLWNPGGPGDVVGNIEKLKQDVWNGKTPSADQMDRIRKLINGHMSGRASADGSQPPPEKLWGWFDKGLWSDALGETGRNLSTGQTSSGQTSWSGIAGRIGIGILTVGQSEWVFMPTAGMYTVKDSIDRGESGLRAFGNAAMGAVIDYGIGKGLEGVLGVGAGAFKGGRTGALEAAEGWAKGIAKEGKDLVSVAGWKKTLGIGAPGTGGGGLDAPDGRAPGGSGADGPGGRPPGGADVPPPPKTDLTPSQQSTASRVKSAADSGDPAAIRRTFQEEGMDSLVDTQRAGGIDPAAARRVNEVVRNDVNQAVQKGTRESIEEFQTRTGVKVKEVMVGDSGSSAHGPSTRLKTDADRTLVPSFDADTLNEFARKNNCTPAEAHDQLSAQFRDMHQQNVSSNLQQMGYSQADIKYGSYDRIGAASGHADSYPNGFTGARQATQGTADVYKVSPDGSHVGDPYRTSGQSLVDQNHLNQQRFGGQPASQGPAHVDPTRIPPSEVPGLVNQQVHTATHSTDPEDLAKAVSRTSKAAAVNGDVLPNQQVVNMAEYMRNNPGWTTGDVERRFGMSMQQFTEQARSQVVGYQQHLGGGR